MHRLIVDREADDVENKPRPPIWDVPLDAILSCTALTPIAIIVDQIRDAKMEMTNG